ncbi:MAG: TetR/AcrR family transcriptional regulator [Pseudomonadota bacterium]
MARTIGSNGKTTRAAIRAKSLALFAESSFAAVSMRRIADEVGVQPAALYAYYPSKQSILVDLLVSHMEELLAAWEEEKCAESPGDALERFSRFHIRYHIKRADAVFLSYMELRALEPEGFKEIEALRKTYEGELRAILEAGQASGEFAVKDPPIAAMAILAMLTGVNTWYRSKGRLSQAAIADRYVAMVKGAAGASVEAAHV